MTPPKPSKRTFVIGFYLRTGWLPWGHQLLDMGAGVTVIPRVGAESGATKVSWVVCCGHTMRKAEVERWKASGLAVDGPPDKFNRPTLVEGPALEQWVADAWVHLKPAHWHAP